VPLLFDMRSTSRVLSRASPVAAGGAQIFVVERYAAQ